jgi:hypothetical protein
METSGTFITDLKAEVLADPFFTEMPSLSRETGELGILVSAITEPLLDFLLAHVDIEKANAIESRESVITSMCRKHGETLAAWLMVLYAQQS